MKKFIVLNGVFESSLWEPNSQIAGPLLNPEGTSSRLLLPLPSQRAYLSCLLRSSPSRSYARMRLRRNYGSSSVERVCLTLLSYDSQSVWCLAVYDVTKFIDEVCHPLFTPTTGLTQPVASWWRWSSSLWGWSVIIFPLWVVIHSRLGKDATEAFEDVGHSDEARALLPGFLVGNFEQGPNVNLISFPLFFLL